MPLNSPLEPRVLVSLVSLLLREQNQIVLASPLLRERGIITTGSSCPSTQLSLEVSIRATKSLLVRELVPLTNSPLEPLSL